MTNLPYIISMEGGDTFARFQFSADAETYAKARSRKYPEVIWLKQMEIQGRMLSTLTRYKAGRKFVDPKLGY